MSEILPCQSQVIQSTNSLKILPIFKAFSIKLKKKKQKQSKIINKEIKIEKEVSEKSTDTQSIPEENISQNTLKDIDFKENRIRNLKKSIKKK